MINWIRHADNYEMQPPSPKFPIAVWISPSNCPTKGFRYVLCVYAGTKLVKHSVYGDFEGAENGAIAWLENLSKDIQSLVKDELDNASCEEMGRAIAILSEPKLHSSTAIEWALKQQQAVQQMQVWGDGERP